MMRVNIMMINHDDNDGDIIDIHYGDSVDSDKSDDNVDVDCSNDKKKSRCMS